MHIHNNWNLLSALEKFKGCLIWRSPSTAVPRVETERLGTKNEVSTWSSTHRLVWPTLYFVSFEKKPMGGEMSFWLLVRPRRSFTLLCYFGDFITPYNQKCSRTRRRWSHVLGIFLPSCSQVPYISRKHKNELSRYTRAKQNEASTDDPSLSNAEQSCTKKITK